MSEPRPLRLKWLSFLIVILSSDALVVTLLMLAMAGDPSSAGSTPAAEPGDLLASEKARGALVIGAAVLLAEVLCYGLRCLSGAPPGAPAWYVGLIAVHLLLRGPFDAFVLYEYFPTQVLTDPAGALQRGGPFLRLLIFNGAGSSFLSVLAQTVLLTILYATRKRPGVAFRPIRPAKGP